IRHTATVSLGGRNVTNDIAIGLRTSVEQAESIKIASGAAVASAVSADEMITVSTPGAREDREISRHVLASIIEPRMEEIFSLTLREMKRSGIGDTPTGGIVLCGGGSALPGSVDLAEQIFDMPVRAGELSGFDHTPDELATPAYATAHGLAAYGFRHEPMRGHRRSSVRNVLKKMENWISNKF
ncbi:MAG: cell division FtsA domain-containing protein, partial [Candidatus Zixiibacteriota bacterium]